MLLWNRHLETQIPHILNIYRNIISIEFSLRNHKHLGVHS